MYDPVSDFYSRPQVGSGGIGVFYGSRRQQGGGIFALIQRFAIPILRRIGERLLRMAPTVGSKAMEVVSDTISDVRSGKKRFGEALKSNISSKVRKTLEEQGLLAEEEKQSGSGYKKRAKKRKGSHKAKKHSHRKIKKSSINKRRSAKKRVSHKKKKAFRDIFAQ